MHNDIYEVFELNSYLFNVEYYNATYRFQFELNTAIEHYIEKGEKEFLKPSEYFDPQFYLECNPDLKGNVENLLYHYIKYGEFEGRYASRTKILSDIKIIKDANIFDERYYLSNFGSDARFRLPVIGQYLVGWRLGRKPNLEFDDLFYYNFYPDVKNGSEPPIIHYIKKGMYEARVINDTQLVSQYNTIKDFINHEYYIKQIDDFIETEDPVLHYIKIGKFSEIRPNPEFSADYYLRLYNDILNAKIDPLHHFASNGFSEGRSGIPNFANIISEGYLEYDYNKPTLVIANHEASRTGAPLVGLNIARELGSKYNIITYFGAHRGLEEEFINSSSIIINGPLSELDLEYILIHLKEVYDPTVVIMNSVETSPFAKAALRADIPSIALIHEFAEYTMPKGKIFEILKSVDRAIVPANIIKNSVNNEVKMLGGAFASNIIVNPQGKLPFLPSNKKINDLSTDDIYKILKDNCAGKDKFVLGAGFATIRKGIDLFVQTAYELSKIRSDIAFIWCGGGYDPQKDPHYSVWINEMVARMGLESTVQFVPEQGNLKNLLDLAQVFYLSSRLDPFPNVVIDAMEADKPIVCFEGATGCAEIFEAESVIGQVVSHCDVSAAAAAIDNIVNTDFAVKANSKFVKEHLDFSNYIKVLEGEIDMAVRHRSTIISNFNILKNNKIFDADFYNGGPIGLLKESNYIKDYISASIKNVSNINPRRGFSENLYRNKYDINGQDCALVSAFNKLKGDTSGLHTHNTYLINNQGKHFNNKSRIAIHIHLHYPDLSTEIAHRISKSNNNIDIYVTTNSDKSLTQIKYAFDNVKNINIKYFVVPNRGRDIGPFLTTVSSELLNGKYDLVGHFHGKKSLSSDPHMGNKWRNFLLDTLIGNQDDTIDNIWSIFAQEKELGLVFAEDRYNVGWSDNFQHAEKMFKDFSIEIELPERPFFPIGTMFWARPEVFRNIWSMKIDISDFPVEPLPYDGTILHAFERVVPSICESEGYKFATVYKDAFFR